MHTITVSAAIPRSAQSSQYLQPCPTLPKHCSTCSHTQLCPQACPPCPNIAVPAVAQLFPNNPVPAAMPRSARHSLYLQVCPALLKHHSTCGHALICPNITAAAAIPHPAQTLQYLQPFPAIPKNRSPGELAPLRLNIAVSATIPCSAQTLQYLQPCHALPKPHSTCSHSPPYPNITVPSAMPCPYMAILAAIPRFAQHLSACSHVPLCTDITVPQPCLNQPKLDST